MTIWNKKIYKQNQEDLENPQGAFVTDDKGKVKKINQDASTDALTVIEYDHHEIHGGSSYTVSDVQNVDTTTMKWQVTTPDTKKQTHMVFNVECTGEMQMLVTEGSDRTDGIALSEVNRDRQSSKTAGTIITRTPTSGSTDGATTIRTIRSGATGVGSKTISAGAGRGSSEFILKRNTKYVIAVTTYADVYVSLHLDWYEHTPKA